MNAVLATPAPSFPRLAAAVLRGVPFPISCPSWCVSDHSEDLVCIEDLSHEGVEIALATPVFGGGVEQVLKARLVQWPFVRESAAYLAMDGSGDGEPAELSASSSVAFGDQLVAYAEAFRVLAAQLGGAS